jgi:putative aldouronate transport system permease protein
LILKKKSESISIRPKKSLRTRIWENREFYILLAPALIYLIVFHYATLYGILLAFNDYSASKGILGSPFVGLDNFRKLFELAKFKQVLGNTLIINFLRLVFAFPMPIILALMLNEVRCSIFKKTAQTIVYLPHFISWVVIAGIMFDVLSSDGLLNTIIKQFGGEGVQFLSNSKTFRPLLIISDIWKETGWGTIIYLAALTSLSPDYYEAALIDGAGRMKQIIYITLPLIAPTISIMLILRMGSMMSGGFDQVFNLLTPTVYDVGDIVDTYVYRIGIVDGRFSMATAVSLFLNVINCILLLSVNTVSKKIGDVGFY